MKRVNLNDIEPGTIVQTTNDHQLPGPIFSAIFKYMGKEGIFYKMKVISPRKRNKEKILLFADPIHWYTKEQQTITTSPFHTIDSAIIEIRECYDKIYAERNYIPQCKYVLDSMHLAIRKIEDLVDNTDEQ